MLCEISQSKKIIIIKLEINILKKKNEEKNVC